MKINYNEYMDIPRCLQRCVSVNKYPPKNSTLIVAVSGGVDSVVLLHALLPLGGTFDWDIIVAHFNHKLRKESDQDAKFVEQLARSLGFKFVYKEADIKNISRIKKQTIEEAGRNMRYKFFNSLAKKYGAKAIVTAHHNDDQIETVVMNFLRGTSFRGLRGMKSRDGLMWRPLLIFNKQDLLEFAQKHQLKFREDKSNKNLIYTRNFIRHTLLPDIKKVNPGFEQSMIRNINNFHHLEKYIDQQIEESKSKIGLKIRKDLVEFSFIKFGQMSLFLRNEMLLHLIELVKGNRQDIKAVHIYEIYKVLQTSKKTSFKQLPGKLLLTKTYDKITISRLRTKKL